MANKTTKLEDAKGVLSNSPLVVALVILFFAAIGLGTFLDVGSKISDLFKSEDKAAEFQRLSRALGDIKSRELAEKYMLDFGVMHNTTFHLGFSICLAEVQSSQ